MKKRYIIYVCFFLLIIFGFGMFGLPTKPVLPTIQLPGEVIFAWPEGSALRQFFGGGFTNTMVGTIITWIIVLGLVLSLRARSRTADEVPTGFYNFFEMIVEGAYGFVEGAAGKWAKTFFPYFMSFILVILIANWLELVPFVDSFGKMENLSEHHVEVAEAAAQADGVELTEEDVNVIQDEAQTEGGKQNGIFLLRANEGEEAGWQVIPFVRAAATDLNFTIGFALLSVIMTQYYGVKALGLGYFKKFFNFNADEIAKNPLGLMDFAVGLLELISELGKILSFGFRLFGNIFAGQVLLFIIGFLLPFAHLAVTGFEFLIGLIQALIFAVLTLTFMAGATVSHSAEEH
ncbi:MAG: F0F1 ATP synthase subunit A [Candidatus Promineifilaceae bacterium]